MGHRSNVIASVAALAVAGLIGTGVGPALAAPGRGKANGHAKQAARSSSTSSTSSTVAGGSTTTTVSKSKAAHLRNASRFTLVGYVKAVDAAGSSLTIAVKGGNRKDLKGKWVLVPVAANASIMRNGAVVTLDKVMVGDHVMVQGANHKARKVRAEGPVATTTTSTTAPATTTTTAPATTTTTAPATTTTTAPATTTTTAPATTTTTAPPTTTTSTTTV